MTELFQKPWNYSLFRGTNGQLVPEVLCGSSVLYEVRHILSAVELEQYQTTENYFLDELAEKIRNRSGAKGKK